jgi:type I restriction enzyme, S subunit
MKNKPRSPFSDNTDFVPKPKNLALPKPVSKIGQQSAAEPPLFQNDLPTFTENNDEERFEAGDFKLCFKNSEVGIIPNEWVVKPLCKVADIRSGFAKNSNVLVSDPIQVHYLRVANVQDGFLNLSEMNQIEISRSDLNRFTVLPGDVLMNEGGDLDKLGRGTIWRGQFNPCIHQNHVFVVRCNQQITPEYLNIWTGTAVARRYFLLTGKQTTNLASINKTALGQLPIALPSLDEQRAIVEALSDVDALLDSLDRLIAKKRDIKQAAMQQLLTGKTRLPGFDGEWEVRQLGDLANLHRENVIPLNSPSQNFIHFSLPAFDSGKVPIVEPGSAIGSNKFRIPPTAILVSKLNPRIPRIWAPLEIDDQCICSTEFLVLVPKAGISREFLYVVCSSSVFCERMELIATGTTGSHQRMNPSDALTIQIPVPPKVDEQSSIATILSDMDADIEALEQRREKTRAIKQGMMQELLTGRTRLV